MRARTKKMGLQQQVATFGAAMSAMAAAPMGHAAIIDLTGNLPGSNPFCGPASCGLSFNFVGGTANDIYQFNDSIGKTIEIASYGNIVGLQLVQASQNITVNLGFTYSVDFDYNAGGQALFAFLTDLGQVGWLQMDLGGPGGDIIYLAAAFNDTPGGAIHAGSRAAVPAPGSAALLGLGLLAMGAAGVRRLREGHAVRA